LTHVLRFILILAPGATFAHEGAHLHPHGSEGALTLFGIATLVAAGAWLMLRGR
jgi:hypothetical protein